MTDTRPHFYFDYEAEGPTSWDLTGNKVCGENLDNSKFYLIIDCEDDTVYELFNEPTNFISSNFYAIVDIYEAIDPDFFQDLENIGINSDLYSEINYLGQINNNINDDEIYVGELEEEPSTPSTTWTIGNKTVSSLFIGNKEVQSIVRTNDNVVLYEKTVTPIPIPETITLNASKDIISYAHNESCTLTLQYPPGYTINIYNNSTDVLLGTMTDNNDNTYQYNYQATGNGDITFRAEIDNKTSTYTIKDIFYYNSGAELSKMSDFNVSGRWNAKNTSIGTVTCTTDEIEWLNITASGLSNYGHIPITPLIGLNQPFKLSCIIKDAARDDRGSGGTYVSTYSGFYACKSTGGYGILLQWHPFRIPRSDKGKSDNWKVLSSAQNPSNSTYKYEATFNGSSITHKLYYLDGSVYKTASVSVSDLNNANYNIEYGISYDNQRSFDIKDIKAELL